MAGGQPVRTDKEKRVRAILAFAAELEAQLPTAASSRTPGTLLEETEKHVSTFPGNIGAAAASKCEEIDSAGTTLWNLCTRLRRDHEAPQDSPVILVAVRVFAFLLLNSAHEAGKGTTENLLRLMKTGIKAAKSSLERKDVQLCTRVLEKVGKYEEILRNPQPDLVSDDAEDRERLCAEYFVLRTALAWHQKQFDIAEHMYKNSKKLERVFDPHTAESLADVLYEMGKGLLDSHEYPMAARWLERAYEVLESQELEKLSMDANELRISIIQSSVKALLGLEEETALVKARSLVDQLADETGDKLIVLLLRLELLSAKTTEIFDSNAYSDVLHRMTRIMSLGDSNFSLIMFHIRKLNDKSPSLACGALEDLMKLRILKQDRVEWVERVLVTRLWISIGQRESPEALSSLDKFFSYVAENVKQPVSAGATLAAHTLLWKRIESNYAQGQYDIAEKWCRLAMHQLFEKSGELNMARISRKLLLCALARKDISSARDIFGSMPLTAQNEPLTRFLMYKIALRSGELELAAESLHIISSTSKKESTLLYACCLDAREVGNKVALLEALQLVLEKHDYGAHATIHLPSLLRITIGLTEALLDEPKAENAEPIIDKLCKLFEGVTSVRKTSGVAAGAEVLWTISELNWYSKNSYNLAMKHISIWAPHHSLRMLTCCIAFIDHYPKGINEQAAEDLSLRKMFCEFSAGTALVVLARGEDNIETQYQYYLNLRKHVSNFDALLVDKQDKMGDEAAQDLLLKLSILLAFDFEAACQLKAWDDLGGIILKAELCKNIRVYELMADCILFAGPPTQVLVNTLKKIINEAWSLETLDSTMLAKYMRCLFQVAISDNVEIAEQLLDQVRAHAEEAHETDQPYPTEELDWIASKAFNHAVDLYCGGEDEACRNWASKALNIAHFCADNGVLEELLQNKLVGLKFDS
ncbi:Sporulation-specific protein [Lachnellula suecica]|uniref:Sporulation-specific protein n=1 Tax=Lachnellula suecica TaxID=602035 RepID=A0A8T9C860_9HELO|nr:Sporulation-specific protein [Lachnellula suecica]